MTIKKETIDQREKRILIQMRQLELDQDVTKRNLKKLEEKLTDFQHIHEQEAIFYQQALSELLLDDYAEDLFRNALDESHWFDRYEQEEISEQADALIAEQKRLIEKENDLLVERRQLYLDEREA